MATIVSHEKKFIFIHIPKTAGRSLDNILSKYASTSWMNHKLIRSALDVIKSFTGLDIPSYTKGKIVPEHSSIARLQISGYDQEIETYYKFCVVRNPWDRARSEYLYQHHYARSRFFRKDYWLTRNGTFMDWLTKAEKDMKLGLHDTQKSLICDLTTGMPIMDKIIPLEKLNIDFPEICDKIGIPRQSVPRINVGGKPADLVMTNDEINMVAKLYKEDLKLFENLGIHYSIPK